jgi:transaldolase
LSRPQTKILLDSGDPAETKRIHDLLGFLDGQTTNPSLVAKNPEIVKMIEEGHKLSLAEENADYKKIIEEISPLVGEAGVSIEVYSDLNTSAEEMFTQGKEMFTWAPNAYIKYPCTKEGLRAAKMSVENNIRVNLTLCFSQEQAAAVYAATQGTKDPVYISPFIGRLDDRGENGVDLVKNILEMFKKGDGHVKVLSASIRGIEHFNAALALGTDLITVPAKILVEWASQGMSLPDQGFVYQNQSLATIPYKEIALDRPWESYDIEHELTTAGIKKFVEDYKATLQV